MVVFITGVFTAVKLDFGLLEKKLNPKSAIFNRIFPVSDFETRTFLAAKSLFYRRKSLETNIPVHNTK